MPRPRIPAKKEKLDLASIKKMFRYLKPHSSAMIVSVFCAIIGAVATIIGPNKIADLMNIITDGIMSSIDMTALVKICIFLICLYAIGGIFSYIQQYIIAVVTQKASKQLRSDIDTKINRLPLSYLDKTTRGDVLSRVTNDVDVISQTFASAVANLVSAVVLFFGLLIMMFISSPILAVVTIASSTLGFVIIGMILSKSQKYFNKKQEYVGDLNGQIEEVYSGYKVVKSFSGSEKEIKNFDEKNEKIYKADWKSHFLSGMMMPIMAFVGNLSFVLIFVIGVALIIKGDNSVTIGTLSSFVIYARLFSQPLSTFAQSMTGLQQASAASKRVFELLSAGELPDESDKEIVLENVKGNVDFKSVKFGYDKNKTIIHDFSASVKAGQKIAIVGPTGAGKTTIVNLLMRFYEMDSGEILIDGVSIKDMRREDVHDLFDMILQDTWLFYGSVRENLVYNKKGITDEELDKVCEAVGLTYFIKTLPHGYDTILDGSTSLSEGQRQQLTIARALLKNSPLLILDEATSNVDTRTELVIQKAMDNLTNNRTSFIIAHRLSTIKEADLILVLKDGDIVESGTHTSLLDKKGFYADLYNSQFVQGEEI